MISGIEILAYVVYFGGLVLCFAFGIIDHTTPKGARLIFLCPLWPILLVVAIVKNTPRAWHCAFGKVSEDKGT